MDNTEIDLVLFYGPSLYGVEIEKLPGEVHCGPAAQGDLLRAVIKYEPAKILLIDGTFWQTLSVWTKEIVFALLEGVVVFGASSMGALRAAECWRYGMVGVGKVFEMYRDGEENDALVAMTYDPVTYRPIVEAPVGQAQKREDALEAVALARGWNKPVETTLDRDAISPALSRVIKRILVE